MLVIEGDHGWLILVFAKFIDSINDFLRHWKWHKIAPDYLLSGAEIKKFVGALEVTSWAKTNGTDGTGDLHVGSHVLMDLSVGSKGMFAMFLVVKLNAGQNVSWAQSIRNATLRWKGV